MEIIRRQAHARAGLIGNPSDGYNGKTISISIADYFAEVVLYEWEEVEVLRSREDQTRFESVHDLARDVRMHGYYGGVRLIKATIKKFVEYCVGRHALHERNFSIRYQSNIPRQVGLAGSSAIIVATLRALMAFYEVSVPLRVQPSLVLSVETDELGIAAGLQDRVIQVYGGAVYMDFSEQAMEPINGLQCGRYEPIEPTALPKLYLAYSPEVGEPTEVFHNNLRARYDKGDSAVIAAMDTFAGLAEEAWNELRRGNSERVGQLMDRNFDTRQSICKLPESHTEMVRLARRAGASAKFAGSGGAIVGTYEGAQMLAELRASLLPLGCRVIVPTIGPRHTDP